MKAARQEKILEIINEFDVGTQEELIERLTHAGLSVTQATVSRDIRELQLDKVLTGKGVYKYVRSVDASPQDKTRFNNAIADSVQNIDHAGNLIVLKTIPGLASAVATGIDSASIPDVLGCVAGDDTIMIVIRDPSKADAVVANLKGMTKIL